MRLARHRHGSTAVGALIGAAALLAGWAVSADPVSVINAIRSEGCGGQPGVGAPVQPDKALDDVARELSRGGRLGEAIDHLGYPASRSTSITVRGTRDDNAIRRMLGERFCAAVNDPQFSELGAFQSGDETWIVLAARSSHPALKDSNAIAARVLELVNAARGQARKCGRRRYDATHPLTLSAALTAVAALHARDMAQRGAMSHRGSDGSGAAERITRLGYRWRAAGENVAAGQPDADTVVANWLDSPGHCTNIMGSQFTEMGVAFAPAPSGSPAVYWAQVFAAPQ